MIENINIFAHILRLHKIKRKSEKTLSDTKNRLAYQQKKSNNTTTKFMS